MRSSNSAGKPPLRLQRYGLLLVPRFSLIALSSVVDPLRLANSVLARPTYEWVTLGLSTDPVVSSDGIRVLPDDRLLVVDQGAHAVRLASDDGKVATLVGQLNQSGQVLGALPARLESPVDVWPVGRDLVITTMTSHRLLRASNAL